MPVENYQLYKMMGGLMCNECVKPQERAPIVWDLDSDTLYMNGVVGDDDAL